MSRRRHRPLAAILGAIAVIGLLTTLVAGYLLGYRAYDIATPSMGRTAPVGTLVITAPVPVEDVRIGDVVTFTSPSTRKITTHRVAAVTPSGLTTKGDINGAPDPVPVTGRDVHGRVIAALPLLGWVHRMLPGLVGGVLVLLVLTHRLNPVVRREVHLVGAAAVFSMTTHFIKPFLGFTILSHTALDAQTESATLVATGALPIRVEGVSSGIDLAPGEVGTVTAAMREDGMFWLVPHLAMGPSWWVAIGLLVISPLLYVLLAPAPPVYLGPPPPPRRARWLGGRPGVIAAAAGSAVVLAAGVALAPLHPRSSDAAFSASVKNATNTAGVRVSNCLAALRTNSPRLLYPMADGAVGSGSSATFKDWSANAWNATTNNALTAGTSGGPCASEPLEGYSVFDGKSVLSPAAASKYSAKPDSYSVEVWFKTTTKGGKFFSFTVPATTCGSGNKECWPYADVLSDENAYGYPVHCYINNSGRIAFATFLQKSETQPAVGSDAWYRLTSPGSVIDGGWHHLVITNRGTPGTSQAVTMYLDGANVASATWSFSTDKPAGYWNFGGGRFDANTADAPKDASNNYVNYYTGQAAYLAVYPAALTAADVTNHYGARL